MIALFLAAAVAASPQQFDLVCSGTASKTFPPAGPVSSSWSQRFSVDIGRGLFHREGAKVNSDIAAVSGGTITLKDEASRFGRWTITLDRTSGAYEEADHDVGFTLLTRATCERAPFSGLLDTKF